MTRTHTQVAIVGFGPVGAALAGLLGQRGIRVVVLERELDVYPLPRAAHIDHQGLRVLQELGCLGELLPHMLPNPGIDFVTADRQLLMRIPGDIPSVSGLPASMYFYQPRFDRALRRAASLPNVDVRLGTTMIGLEPCPTDVMVSAVERSGAEHTVSADFVVGCDGSGSAVRQSVEMSLRDLNFDEQWIVVDLKLNRNVPTLPDRAVTVCDPNRPQFAIPIPEGRFRFELQLRPGEDVEQAQRPEAVFEMLRDWLGPEDAHIERSAVYTFHGLVAQPWRVGRVLVAGDAAHMMPPFLGQGMNSGFRDASNLAWKLALVVSGEAPDLLLDTYELERRPHVTKIVEAAIRYGAIIQEQDPERAAERDARWLQQIEPPEQRLPFRLPPLMPGPLVMNGGGELFPQPPDSLAAGRLDDYVGHRFLVISRQPEKLRSSGGWWAEKGALVCPVSELPDPHGRVRDWMLKREAEVVVVRPDHYVLAAGKDLDEITAHALPWLGPAPAKIERD